MDEFLRLSGVHAHYGESHILHGVPAAPPRSSRSSGWSAGAPARS